VPATPCTPISCTCGVLLPRQLHLRHLAVGRLHLRQLAVGRLHLRQLADGRLHLRKPADGSQHLRQFAVGSQHLRLLHLRHPEHLDGAATASAATAPCNGNLDNEQRE
jgi:hypothetical protein